MKAHEIKARPKMFFVAMSKSRPQAGAASCVDDDPKVVREFRGEYSDFEIRHVDGDEMARLMTA